MYRCIVNQAGEILLHRTMNAAPEPSLQAMAPYRDDLVVGVEGLLTWYWLADLCAPEGMPFVLGHALSMQAIHGGQAQPDQIDAPKMAVLLRGGMLPQAYVYPATMWATRDLRRRRMQLVRTRAEWLAHIQQTNSQYTLPELGKKLASKANRAGVAERFPEPAVQKTMALDRTLIDASDRLVTDLARDLVSTAKAPDAQTFYRLRSIPGVGKILALVLRYEIHDITRFPRVQACVSECRLVKGANASAGQRSGTSGKQIGPA
jgi:transposase